MKRLQINTTQNVNINFEMANVGQRLLAFITDNVIKFAYIYFLIQFLSFTLFREVINDDYWSVKAIDVLLFLPITFYSLYSEILLNGQTIGKKLLKIRVINVDGYKPSLTDYVIRWFLRMVDFNAFILIFVYLSSLGTLDQYPQLLFFIFLFGKMVGFFFIIFTEKNQRIGDLSANTVVIYLKDQTQFSHTILENLQENYRPIYPNVIKLSDNDMRIIKDTFTVAAKNNDHKTLIKLKNKIEEVTGIQSTQNTTKDFIRTVLRDYNYYTQDM